MFTRFPARPLACALLLVSFVLGFARESVAQSYTYTPIDSSGSNYGSLGEAINSSGQAVVKYLDFDYNEHLLLFLPNSPNSAAGTVEDIPAPTGYTYSTTNDAVSINDNGIVAVVAENSSSTSNPWILFFNPLGSPISPGEQLAAIYSPNSITAYTTGVEINDDDEVAYTNGTDVYVWYPTPIDNFVGAILSPPLDSGYNIVSTGLDNNGDVVAEASSSSFGSQQMQLFLWTPATPNGLLSDPPTAVSLGVPPTDEVLPSYPGAVPFNNSGQVGIEVVDGNLDSHLYLLGLSSGTLSALSLGAFSILDGYAPGGDTIFGPAAINDNGDGAAVLYGGIVGPFACSPSGSPISLDQFGYVESNVTVQHCPVAMNDFGQVVAGASLYTPAAVVVSQPPKVTLISPANGKAFSASDKAIPLVTRVSPAKHTKIEGVVFESNGSVIATGVLNPVSGNYVADWDPAGVSGQYRITAVATDSAGNTGTSPTATISVGATLISSEVQVTRGGLIFNHQPPYSYVQDLTITNTSENAIPGPIQILLTNLPAGISVPDKTARLATSPGPGPYFTIPAASLPGGFASGESVSVTIIFSDPSNRPVSYGVQVYSGVF